MLKLLQVLITREPRHETELPADKLSMLGSLLASEDDVHERDTRELRAYLYALDLILEEFEARARMAQQLRPPRRFQI